MMYSCKYKFCGPYFSFQFPS